MNPLEVFKNAVRYTISDKKTFLKLMPFTAVMYLILEFYYQIYIDPPIMNGILILLYIIIFIMLGGFAFLIVKYGEYNLKKFPNFSLGNLKKGFVILLALSISNLGGSAFNLTPTIDYGQYWFTFTIDPLYYILFIIVIVFIGRYAYYNDCWKALRIKPIWHDIKDIGIINMIIHVIIISVFMTICQIPIELIFYIDSIFDPNLKLLAAEVLLFILHILLSTIWYIYLFRSIGLIYSGVINNESDSQNIEHALDV